MNSTKNEVRKTLLNRRNLLTQKEINEYSRIICSKLRELEQFKQSKVIFAYAGSKNEVSTSSLIQDIINEEKDICLPLTKKDSIELEFYRIFDMNEDLMVGRYGILEPIPNPVRLVSQQDAEVIIIPGVAFDLSLNRIGYGKGYYDNFLSNISKKVAKIALAYDFQVLENIPSEENDIKMDMIITEKRIITV